MGFLTRVGPEVHFQTGLSFKFFLANLTLMQSRFVFLPHFLSQMNAFVVDRQVIMAPEALPTFFTLVCFLTRVYFLMFGQVIMAYEGFPTFVTLIALVVMVDSEVEPVGAAMTEALATDTTEVRLLPTVDPQVLPQSGPFSYRFPTNEAGPFSFASMCALNVPLPVACVIKLSATNLTWKRT